MKALVTGCLALTLVAFGCSPGGEAPALAPAGGTQETGANPLLVPPGFGTLTQETVTLRLQRGDLLIKVTPLEEWVIRLTAPDTYARLHGLAQTHGERAAQTAMVLDPCLFLVSFFSYQPDVTYEPEELLLVNRGLRYRPLGIAPLTPSWGTQRLGQQETRMAVYAFEGGMDLETDLGVEYKELRNAGWREGILPQLRAEAPKARARAGGGEGT
jgi:hypothetical protein